MPSQNDNGGDNGPKNPWGSGPKSPWGTTPPRRPTPPPRSGNSGGDIEAFLRRSGDRLRGAFPGGDGGGGQQGTGNRLMFYGIAGFIGIWIALTSTYRIDAQERGVVLRFGKYIETVGPGFHFKLPSPIDDVLKPKVEQV